MKAAPDGAPAASLVTAIDAAEPGVPVAVKVTGEPASEPEVASSVFVPVVVPKVQLVTAATPDASVEVDPPTTDPLPGLTVNVTAIPSTGLPCASLTRTDGAILTEAPAVADWLSPASSEIEAAGPGPDGEKFADVAEVNPPNADSKMS